MDIEKVITDAFKDVCKGKEIKRETVIKELGIDSLDLVECLMTIEETLDIEFTDEEMMSLTIVDDLYKAIENKLN